MEEVFTAATQYSDLKGTIAADEHDKFRLSDLLRERGLLADDEIVVGIQMFSGEVHARTQERPISVTAYIAGPDMDTFRKRVEGGGKVDVRTERLELPLNEFFGLFKRFEVMFSRNGVLTGKEVVYEERER